MAPNSRWSEPASWKRSEAQVWRHWDLQPKERVLEVGTPQHRIRVQEAGSGPPVLLVHGTGGYGPYWAPLVAKLGNYRSLILDRPGWGGSDPVDFSQAGYRDLVGDLTAGVLTALGVDKVHAVGASIGDSWALALASKYPDRVMSVTLLGAGPLTDEIEVPLPIRLLGSPLGALMSRVRWREKMETGQARRSGHGPALDDGRMPQLFVDWKVDMTNGTEWRVHERNMVRATVGRGGWKPGLTFDAQDLSSLSMPVLMVLGTADPVAPLETLKDFVAQIPDGTLNVIQGAGHLPWFDDPEHVAESLRDHFHTATP